MPQSKVELFNLALTFSGQRGSDVAEEDEDSIQADLCRLWYPLSRDQVFKSANWDSVKAVARLALLAVKSNSADWSETDPEPGFQYAYQLPHDLVHPRRLVDFSHFSIGTHASTRALFTNFRNPVLIYTKQEDRLDLWDAALYGAVAASLGYNISMALHSKLDFVQQAADRANFIILEARVAQANQTDDRVETLPDFLVARGYPVSAQTQRYIYPLGSLIAQPQRTNIAR